MRQYSGTLGRTGHCQIAVSLHAVGPKMSACIDAQAYLPEPWAYDPRTPLATRLSMTLPATLP